MKVKIVWLLIFIFHVFCVRAQEKKIAVDVVDKPLKALLNDIEEETRFSILYSDDVISDSMKITIRLPLMPVSRVLDTILASKGLFFSTRPDDMIVIGSNGLRLADSLRMVASTTISGVVKDESGSAISFATVSLLIKDSVLKTIACNEDGTYQLSWLFQPGHTYTLKSSSIGFESNVFSFLYPDTSALKNILMIRDKTLMKNVVIKSSKQVLERLTDRFIVNVDGTSLENSLDALDVLRKAPGIWVDAEGQIFMSGNKSVMVMINGVIQRMTGSQLVLFLRSLKATDIKKIEIIPNPPAEFEASASGGIINIELKKTMDNGLHVQAGALFEWQKNRPRYVPSLSFNAKLNKISLWGNVAYTVDRSEYVANSTTSYADTSFLTSAGDRYNRNTSYNVAFGVIYDISGKQSLGFQGIINGQYLDQDFHSRLRLESTADTIASNAFAKRKSPQRYTGTTLNYTLKLDTIGSVFKIAGDYIYANANDRNTFTSEYDDPANNTRYRNFTPNQNKLYSAQADFLRVSKSGFRLSSGVKYFSTKRDNTILTEYFFNNTWNKDDNSSNHFIYDENIWMGYTAAEKKIKNTSFKAGLRAEQTEMIGNSLTDNEKFRRSYFNLFPSFFVSQSIHKDVLSLSYSRRINRPKYSKLNPFRIYFSDYGVLTGNPELLPEFSNVFIADYLFRKKYIASFNYTHTINSISNINILLNNNVVEQRPVNFKSQREYATSIYAPLELTKWWKLNVGVFYFYQQYELPDLKVEKGNFLFNIFNTINLGNNFETSFFLMYRTPYIEGNIQWRPLLTSQAVLTKSFWNKRLRLQLFAEDLLNSFREKYIQENNGIRVDFYQKRPTRTVGINATYNLNFGKTVKERKIEQSNIEEKRRL